MTLNKIQLETIIKKNTESAERGCHKSQGLVIMAQLELDELVNQQKLNQWRFTATLGNQDHAWRSRERNWGVEPEGS